MSNVYRSESTLSEAFDDLIATLIALAGGGRAVCGEDATEATNERAWTCNRERAGLRHAAGDVRHHVCAVIADLEEAARYAQPLRPHSMFEGLGDGTRVLAHEAFLSVLSLGQLVRRASEDRLAPVPDLELARLAISAMLDELCPYVSRSDDALRRVLLDHEPFEVALARVGRAG